MRLRIALLALLVAAPAFAEDAAPTPVPTETPAPAVSPAAPAAVQSTGTTTQAITKFYLEVDANDLTAISQALNELPKKIADPLILKLNGQLQAQAQAAIAETKDKAEKAKKGKK